MLECGHSRTWGVVIRLIYMLNFVRVSFPWRNVSNGNYQRAELINVARVSGDFFPRTSRPSVALAVKDSHAYFVLYERCSISPLLVLVKKSPKLCMLAFNNRVYRRDFSIFLLRLANQQPAALRDDLPKRLKRSARRQLGAETRLSWKSNGLPTRVS